MGIDKIGSINNYNEYNKINKSTRIAKTKASDSVKISQEAASMAENKKIMDIINNTPDIRKDRVEAVKEKLKNPDYINDKLIDSLADNILHSFKI